MENLLSWLMNEKDVDASLTLEFFAPSGTLGPDTAPGQIELVKRASELPGDYEMKSLARHVSGSEKGFVGPYDKIGFRLQREAIENGEIDKHAAVGWAGEDRSKYFLISMEQAEKADIIRLAAGLDYAALLAGDPEQTERCISLARAVWNELPVWYGCGNLGVAKESGSSSNVDLAIEAWSSESRIPLADFTASRDEAVADQFASKVKGAYWLNLLGETHVKALGGIDAIDEALPENIRLEEFKRGGALIQLTPSPELDNSLENQDKFDELKQLLKPITVEM